MKIRFACAMQAGLLAAFVVSAAALAQTAEATAQSFIEAIYKPYLAKDYSGVRLDTPGRVRRYFEPKLADAMIRDAAAAKKKNEVGTLDGDPFIDAQDWRITNLAMDVKSANGKATATVTFNNIGEPKQISLNLVKTAGGWRILDIRAPSGSLRQLFKVK